jgi:hypothetical protein
MSAWTKVNRLKSFIRFADKPIRIEGGLGSQIFGLSKYKYALEHFDQPVKLDLTYFTSPRKARNHPGLSFWPWALDIYGHSLVELHFENQKSQSIKRGHISPVINDAKVWEWLKKNHKYFPIQSEQRDEALNKLDISGDFNAIHIRRGDYTRIGAQITEHEKYLGLIAKMKGLIANSTIVFSDDEIDKSSRAKYESILGSKTYFLSSEHFSDRVSHDLMRSANNLITANSTFSISAAMLNCRANLIFSPISFTKEDVTSNSFLSLGDWYLHS